jgi:hypothetical protein
MSKDKAKTIQLQGGLTLSQKYYNIIDRTHDDPFISIKFQENLPKELKLKIGRAVLKILIKGDNDE